MHVDCWTLETCGALGSSRIVEDASSEVQATAAIVGSRVGVQRAAEAETEVLMEARVLVDSWKSSPSDISQVIYWYKFTYSYSPIIYIIQG